METGIATHLSKPGPDRDMVVEYVECRTSYCEIAGYEKSGVELGIGKTLSEMRRSGWWQAFGGTHTHFVSSDGLHRFIVILERKP